MTLCVWDLWPLASILSNQQAAGASSWRSTSSGAAVRPSMHRPGRDADSGRGWYLINRRSRQRETLHTVRNNTSFKMARNQKVVFGAATRVHCAFVYVLTIWGGLNLTSQYAEQPPPNHLWVTRRRTWRDPYTYLICRRRLLSSRSFLPPLSARSLARSKDTRSTKKTVNGAGFQYTI